MSTIAIKERPILFSAPMVRAILRGAKTQTRRVVKPQPQIETPMGAAWRDSKCDFWRNAGQYERDCCPYGQAGDRLWVRESWAPMQACRPIPNPEKYDNKPAWYRADNDRPMWAGNKWKPSIFMPRNCSRLTLEITDIRVERLQKITDRDAMAEGVDGCRDLRFMTVLGNLHSTGHKLNFIDLWNKLNAKRGFSWESNPWVWVVGFSVASPEQPGRNEGEGE